jgi:hypothetical protein
MRIKDFIRFNESLINESLINEAKEYSTGVVKADHSFGGYYVWYKTKLGFKKYISAAAIIIPDSSKPVFFTIYDDYKIFPNNTYNDRLDIGLRKIRYNHADAVEYAEELFNNPELIQKYEEELKKDKEELRKKLDEYNKRKKIGRIERIKDLKETEKMIKRNEEEERKRTEVTFKRK